MIPMTQYLISVLAEGSPTANTEEDAASDVFNAQLQANGHWVFAGGLGSTVAATVIDARGGDPVVTDGPFVETKEYVAGFWIVEAPHLDVALQLATQGSKSCNRRVELRPFLEV
jgi:hypothetical protein